MNKVILITGKKHTIGDQEIKTSLHLCTAHTVLSHLVCSDSEDIEVSDIGGGGEAEVTDIQLNEAFECEYPQFKPD